MACFFQSRFTARPCTPGEPGMFLGLPEEVRADGVGGSRRMCAAARSSDPLCLASTWEAPKIGQ
eukprot:7348026-Pyramimonas_sp.AAC.1